jgi:hypothetical protein
MFMHTIGSQTDGYHQNGDQFIGGSATIEARANDSAGKNRHDITFIERVVSCHMTLLSFRSKLTQNSRLIGISKAGHPTAIVSSLS